MQRKQPPEAVRRGQRLMAARANAKFPVRRVRRWPDRLSSFAPARLAIVRCHELCGNPSDVWSKVSYEINTR